MVSVDLSLLIVVIAVAVIFVVLGGVVGYRIGAWVTVRRKQAEFDEAVPILTRDAVSRSRSSLSGQFLEKIAPHLPEFAYDPTELRFIGTPIDYVVFRGLSTGRVEEVVFLEVKSGKSNLSSKQRGVRDAIEAGAVRWDVYKVPVELADQEGEDTSV